MAAAGFVIGALQAELQALTKQLEDVWADASTDRRFETLKKAQGSVCDPRGVSQTAKTSKGHSKVFARDGENYKQRRLGNAEAGLAAQREGCAVHNTADGPHYIIPPPVACVNSVLTPLSLCEHLPF